MSKISFILFIAIGLTFSAFCQKSTNKMDSISYSLGVLIAQNLKGQGFDKLDPASLTLAVQDVLAGKPTSISAEEAGKLVNSYIEKQKMSQSEGIINEGKTFLEDNAKKPGVVLLPSGMQYTVMKEGTGPKPGPNDKVTTHYHGTLISGEVFDSSVDRGEPASFPVNGVIKGWTEALQLMPVGSKWKLFIPSPLAYGERGAGGKIKPYATLVFEVELLSIDK